MWYCIQHLAAIAVTNTEKWYKEMKDWAIIFLYLAGGVLVLSGVGALMGKLVVHFLG